MTTIYKTTCASCQNTVVVTKDSIDQDLFHLHCDHCGADTDLVAEQPKHVRDLESVN